MGAMEWLLLGVSVALMVLCGIFGAAEYSFVAVDRAAVDRAASSGDRAAEGVRKALRSLSTQLSGYYLTGVRLTWNFGGLYTYHKDKLINKNNQEMVLAQRNTFLFNTSVTMRQQNADIVRYQQLIQSDNDIVNLRDSIKQTSAVQLQNGVITANDYLLDINAEAQARQDKTLHEVQLLMAQYNHKTTAGN